MHLLLLASVTCDDDGNHFARNICNFWEMSRSAATGFFIHKSKTFILAQSIIYICMFFYTNFKLIFLPFSCLDIVGILEVDFHLFEFIGPRFLNCTEKCL